MNSLHEDGRPLALLRPLDLLLHDGTAPILAGRMKLGGAARAQGNPKTGKDFMADPAVLLQLIDVRLKKFPAVPTVVGRVKLL